MRDEKEERKEASKVKQTRQSNTAHPRQSLFLEKMSYMYIYMNNHVHRTSFSDIERKKEVAKSKERRKEIHNFINY